MSGDLDAMLAAVRAAGDGEAGSLAGSTRSRVRRSLERRARTRHRSVRGATVAAVLLVSTMSWALSTGRLSLISRQLEPQPEPVRLELPALPSPSPVRYTAPIRVHRKPQIEAPVVAPEIDPTPAPTAAPAIAEAPVAAPIAEALVRHTPRPAETLYRAAHALHFHGGDAGERDWWAVLAAWDAYLAGEPTGRFAIDARYNRALVLVRLGRYADARTALLPFAAGDHAGYRQHEAAQIVERLDQIGVNGPRGSGD